MKNKYKYIMFVALSFFMVILASCGRSTIFDKYKDEGSTIKVEYDGNGGTYLDREGITLIDLINPDKYSADSNGIKHIKLLDPTDSRRKSGGSEGVYITRADYFLVGWYKNKEIVTNSNGIPVNDAGEELVFQNEEYFLASDLKVKSTPAYKYSGYWNFDTDTIDYDSSMKEFNMTLYAVWSKYFQFNYYFEVDGSWVKSDSVTTFDYQTTNAPGSKTKDKDTIWVPSYVDGAMNYSHKYEGSGEYKFPKYDGYTFKAAYLDKEKTKPISSSFEHLGSIDYETGKAVNPVQDIYVTLDKGEIYYISTPQQLIDNASLRGTYIIENDLDFAGYEWPQIFNVGTFQGKILSASGSTVTIRNVSVVHNSENAKTGGLFGKIAANAEISNITFQDACLDLSNIGQRNRDTMFGLFAGMVEDAATITNVAISGSLRIGNIAIGEDCQIGLVTGNDSSKILPLGNIKLVVYGISHDGGYKYTVNPDLVTVESNLVQLVQVTTLIKENESYVIEYI